MTGTVHLDAHAEQLPRHRRTTPRELIGEIFRNARRANGLTQEQLAAKSLVSVDTVRNIENARSYALKATVHELEAIAKALDRVLSIKPFPPHATEATHLRVLLHYATACNKPFTAELVPN
jgi:transcriptional regulator with XRE-family HTH domain